MTVKIKTTSGTTMIMHDYTGYTEMSNHVRVWFGTDYITYEGEIV